MILTFKAFAICSRLSSVGEYFSFMMLLIVDFEMPVMLDNCRTEMLLLYMMLSSNIFMEILFVKYKFIIPAFYYQKRKNSNKIFLGGIHLEIQYSKQAIKFLKKQDAITKKRIVNAINLLPAGDVKALQGRNGYRLRVGDYRIIFDTNGNILLIEAIGNRGQIYKGV